MRICNVPKLFVKATNGIHNALLALAIVDESLLCTSYSWSYGVIIDVPCIRTLY